MPFTFNLLNTRVSNSKSAPNSSSDSLFLLQTGGKKIAQNTIENSKLNKRNIKIDYYTNSVINGKKNFLKSNYFFSASLGHINGYVDLPAPTGRPTGSITNNFTPFVSATGGTTKTHSTDSTSSAGEYPIEYIGFQENGSDKSFRIKLDGGATGWTIDPAIKGNIALFQLFDKQGNKVREYNASNCLFQDAGGEISWQWWAADNFGKPAGERSNYTLAQERAFWGNATIPGTATNNELIVAWNGNPLKRDFSTPPLQRSAPKLYKKIGSSKTHYDGTGSRLLKLKASARR